MRNTVAALFLALPIVASIAHADTPGAGLVSRADFGTLPDKTVARDLSVKPLLDAREAEAGGLEAA